VRRRYSLYIVALLLQHNYIVLAVDLPPPKADQYKKIVIREVRFIWGINAPIAVFGSQIQQESGYNEKAKSYAGALGLSQFMPSTSEWISKLYPKELGLNQPLNPDWAIRALARYDYDLYKQNAAITECDRHSMMLSSYNGGQGNLNKDKKLALVKGKSDRMWWDNVALFSSRNSEAFIENRNYPKIILLRYQKLYITWGPLVECKFAT